MPSAPKTRHALLDDLRAAFARELATEPAISLRAGDAIDDHRAPPAFDAGLDAITDGYLEAHALSVAFLDAASWRHYIPHLFEYALRRIGDGGLVTDALLGSLRPPDRDPPRLGSLSSEQEAPVSACLHELAFNAGSANQEFACQVLEEWWIPGALFRRRHS